jgi:hypothetical protein
MASRYSGTPIINGGRSRGTSDTVNLIREGISNQQIPFDEIVLQEAQRLDIIAGIEYGDSSLWWILAAASNIGWGLQVPPGTLIRVPNLQIVLGIIS